MEYHTESNMDGSTRQDLYTNEETESSRPPQEANQFIDRNEYNSCPTVVTETWMSHPANSRLAAAVSQQTVRKTLQPNRLLIA